MTQILTLLVLQVPEVTNVQNRKPTVQVFSSTILPSTSQIRITTCKAELQQLIQQKREQCSAERIAKQMMGNAEWESKPPPPGACAVEGRWYSSPGAWAWNPVEETGDSYRQRKWSQSCHFESPRSLMFFPGGPGAEAPRSQCRGARFASWSWN